MMCGGSFCVWSILVAAAFLVSGLALSVFASQIHLSQRERPWHNGILRVDCQRLPLWGSWQNRKVLTERARMLKRKMDPMNLILASGSPRRRELLSLYTTDFTVCVSDFDESAVQADTPAQLVEQLARGKCLAVSAQHPGAVVIGCDTVVDVNGEVFGKPHSTEDAKRMLRALSGAAHEVHTGVCISDGTRTESFVDSCRVTFFPLSGEEIDFYASTAEPYDKAGAYAIQGRAALWLDRIEGDYYTIMGLPVSRTVQLLAHFV